MSKSETKLKLTKEVVQNLDNIISSATRGDDLTIFDAVLGQADLQDAETKTMLQEFVSSTLDLDHFFKPSLIDNSKKYVVVYKGSIITLNNKSLFNSEKAARAELSAYFTRHIGTKKHFFIGNSDRIAYRSDDVKFNKLKCLFKGGKEVRDWVLKANKLQITTVDSYIFDYVKNKIN